MEFLCKKINNSFIFWKYCKYYASFFKYETVELYFVQSINSIKFNSNIINVCVYCQCILWLSMYLLQYNIYKFIILNWFIKTKFNSNCTIIPINIHLYIIQYNSDKLNRMSRIVARTYFEFFNWVIRNTILL